jgi:hypothetical protein
MHFPFEILIWEPRYFRIVSPKIKWWQHLLSSSLDLIPGQSTATLFYTNSCVSRGRVEASQYRVRVPATTEVKTTVGVPRSGLFLLTWENEPAWQSSSRDFSATMPWVRVVQWSGVMWPGKWQESEDRDRPIKGRVPVDAADNHRVLDITECWHSCWLYHNGFIVLNEVGPRSRALPRLCIVHWMHCTVTSSVGTATHTSNGHLCLCVVGDTTMFWISVFQDPVHQSNLKTWRLINRIISNYEQRRVQEKVHRHQCLRLRCARDPCADLLPKCPPRARLPPSLGIPHWQVSVRLSLSVHANAIINPLATVLIFQYECFPQFLWPITLKTVTEGEIKCSVCIMFTSKNCFCQQFFSVILFAILWLIYHKFMIAYNICKE